jgi:hypothetical protein
VGRVGARVVGGQEELQEAEASQLFEAESKWPAIEVEEKPLDMETACGG